MTTRERKKTVDGLRGSIQTATEWIERLTRARKEMLRTEDPDNLTGRLAPLYEQLRSGTGHSGSMRWNHPPQVAHLLEGWGGEGINVWTERRQQAEERLEVLEAGLPSEEATAAAQAEIETISADLARLDTLAADRWELVEATLREALDLATEVIGLRGEQDALIDRGSRLAEDYALSCREKSYPIPGTAAQRLLEQLQTVSRVGSGRAGSLLKDLQRLRNEQASRGYVPAVMAGEKRKSA